MSGGKLDWRAKVELYEQIRREYEFGAGTIQGVARKLGVHRRMVREAIQSAIRARRKKTERPHWKMAAAAAFIEGILESDRKAPAAEAATTRSAARIYDAHPRRDPGMHGSRAHGAAVCRTAQACSGTEPPRDVGAAELRLGRRSPDGLV